MFDHVRLRDLPRQSRSVLRAPSNTRPAIWVVEEGGVRAVVKDYSRNRFFFRNTFGRFLIWREARAYKKNVGLTGVPKLFRVIDGLALVMEEVQGKDISRNGAHLEITPAFLEELKVLVDAFHQRGLAHCDLKSAGNIFVGVDGHPHILDWASAISESRFRFPFLNLIYQRFVQDDCNAVTKYKMVYMPESVNPVERENYCHRSWIEKTVRSVRDRLRGMLQAIS